ncbi:protein FAM136A-like [Condylostylus longicornis]|uniref:protein FAM136A-like n=1 Tax=Condylostylus longicornis TaxID=2530218 RepID=UPI00244DA827|nr:protein FAM136A-like [Condylostylus longicornis]
MSFQDAARDFESKVEGMMKTITKAVLPLQRKSYECCVKCFDNSREELDTIGKCIQECQAPAEAFGDRLRQEMQTFQNQISGCQQSCHNKFSMAFSDAKEEVKRNEIQSHMESCAVTCFSDVVPQLDEMKQRMLQLVTKQLQQP